MEVSLETPAEVEKVAAPCLHWVRGVVGPWYSWICGVFATHASDNIRSNIFCEGSGPQ